MQSASKLYLGQNCPKLPNSGVATKTGTQIEMMVEDIHWKRNPKKG